jgi:hypothetical protein
LAEPYSLRWRTGVGIPDGKSPMIYAWTKPRPGWYLNWSVGYTETMWITDTVKSTGPGKLSYGKTVEPRFHIPPDDEAGMEFAPMVRMKDGELAPPLDWIAATAAARPGHTWLIGNEPDVRWQDNTRPEDYATSYHDAYYTIKSADPTAQVAIGGLSQITPLRLAYLNQVWNHYADTYGEEMPVDIWTMHAFILQEKSDDWGVDMPPGFEDDSTGMLWQIDDHDDLALVQEQILRMRQWMADRGQKEKPLWITEYGILMPTEYGFDEERVRRFLVESMDLFANVRNPGLGYAADDDRLVQRWVWFSAGYDLYPTGNLFTADGQPTDLMRTLSAHITGSDD